MAAYARQAKDQDLILWATEIKVRAERKCGEMLRATQANNGRGKQVATCDQHPPPPTLSEIGLTKSESSRYQQLASMSDEHFEAAVATAKGFPRRQEIAGDAIGRGTRPGAAANVVGVPEPAG